jgi:hypothetical protein
LPYEVFIKNRLIKKENQEALLQRLLTNTNDFKSFYDQLSYPSLFVQFTEYNAMNVVLKIFQSAGLLDELTVKKYTAVSIDYNKNGFRGILSYEIKQVRDTSTIKPPNIDRAYEAAFKTQREIIEHKFPQFLTLFESIFACAAQKLNRDLVDFSLAKVIRYYETGVRSYFGEQLIEFGFPTDTVREIEKRHKQLISADSTTSKNYITQHHDEITKLLDDYEKGLYTEAIKSLN